MSITIMTKKNETLKGQQSKHCPCVFATKVSTVDQRESLKEVKDGDITYYCPIPCVWEDF